MFDDAGPFKVPEQVLRNALKDGALLALENDGKVIKRPLRVARIDKLVVPSGELIAGDVGMAFEMASSFVRRVRPGTYDVVVSIWGASGRGNTPSDGMGDSARAAYLALLLGDETPVKFAFAASGACPEDWVPSDQYEGFGVDVGGVAFLDAQHLDAVRRLPESTDFIALGEHAYRQRPDLSGVAGCIQLPLQRPLKVPMCDSGWGDGSYFSYWAFGAASDPVALIVDFDLEGKWTGR